MGPLIYKWDPSFINEDIYVSFGTNGTPYEMSSREYKLVVNQLPFSQQNKVP